MTNKKTKVKTPKKTAVWPPKELEPFRVDSITILSGSRFRTLVTYKNVAVKLAQMGGMTVIMLKDKLVEVATMRVYEIVCKSDSLIYKISYEEMLADWDHYDTQKKKFESKEKESEKDATYG